MFSSHLLQIVSMLRMVRMFFSMGGTRVPFLDQRILVPQCSFCCSMVLYGNRYRSLWSCRPLGRLAAWPLGRLAAGSLDHCASESVYDERTIFAST